MPGAQYQTPTGCLSAPNTWCANPASYRAQSRLPVLVSDVPLSNEVMDEKLLEILLDENFGDMLYSLSLPEFPQKATGSNLDDDDELPECLANGEVREILGLSGSPLPVLDGATGNDPLDIQLRPRKLNALSKIMVIIDAARTPLYNKNMGFIGAGPVMRDHKVYALPLDRLREALKLRRVCHELKQLVDTAAVVMWGVIMHRAMHRGAWRGNCYGDHDDSRVCLNTAHYPKSYELEPVCGVWAIEAARKKFEARKKVPSARQSKRKSR